MGNVGSNVSLARVNKDTMIVVGPYHAIVFIDNFPQLITWGDVSIIPVGPAILSTGTIVRDLGRFVNFYDESNNLISTLRQVQQIGAQNDVSLGSGSEGVARPETVEPWRVGWMVTFIAETGTYPITSDNVARSVSPADQVSAFLAAYKGRIYMDSGVGTVRRLVRA